MGRYVIAAASAAAISLRHARTLGVTAACATRYLKKAVYCALCYADFGVSGTTGEAWRAGQAAFLSTAFDVLTDWRHDEPQGARTFDRLVTRYAREASTRELAMSLYAAKLTRTFGHDGLDRGAVALRLILRVMGCEDARAESWGDLDEVGRLLQLVDDLLDVEDDLTRGDMNVLLVPNGPRYVSDFLDRHRAGDWTTRFGPGRPVLLRVIDRAAAKAEAHLATARPAPA